jgi:hypothetical protein
MQQHKADPSSAPPVPSDLDEREREDQPIRITTGECENQTTAIKGKEQTRRHRSTRKTTTSILQEVRKPWPAEARGNPKQDHLTCRWSIVACEKGQVHVKVSCQTQTSTSSYPVSITPPACHSFAVSLVLRQQKHQRPHPLRCNACKWLHGFSFTRTKHICLVRCGFNPTAAAASTVFSL